VTLSPRGTAYLRAAQLAACLLLAAYLAQALIPSLEASVGDVFEDWVYPALGLAAGGFCAARAVIFSTERAAWAVLAAGITASAAGDLWWLLARYDYAPSIPAFTPADALWLAFYPACLAGIALLVRSRVRGYDRGIVVDGAIGALALASVGAALVWGALAAAGVTDTGGDFPVDLANFFGDVVLVGVATALLAVTGWRPGRSLGLLGAGLVLAACADGFFLWQGATGFDPGTTAIAALTPGSMLLIGFAAWERPVHRSAVASEGWRTIAVPSAFAVTALAVLLVHAFTPVNGLAMALAAATLAAVIARMAISLSDHMGLLATSRHEALTDALTGLGNRRRLMADLERQLARASADEPCALMLFDLDGFKQYNDWYGHPAGDTLLARLGSRLAAAVEPTGTPYRLGGDEFCAIVPCGDVESRRVRSAAIAALSDIDCGFEVSSSCGYVTIPRDADTTASVLQTADERLYAQKARRRRFSVGLQATSALVQAMQEREPDLGDHVNDVAALAGRVGAAMGMEGEPLEEVVRAAELHDVGKVAVPDSILHKPGPLSEAEWGSMREHTLVGDRILSAAPALEGVAKLVRSSHERWDGLGYPDRLMGDEIPLGARIVAVCDAYHAMISNRPYRSAISHGAALEELSSCAGQQFDPAVVDAFVRVVAGAPPLELQDPRDELSRWRPELPGMPASVDAPR
jgi:diguanylate cyclase (GGDEF)-like protein